MSAKKACTSRERDFAKLLEEVGLGAIEAYRKAFMVKCEDKATKQKARDLARSGRVREERARIRVELEKGKEVQNIVSTSGALDVERLREFAFRRLVEIRDDPTIKSATRLQAVNALKKLHDPSRDVNLIWRWIDMAWRYQKAHCPCCHKSFPLDKIKNKKLESYRSDAELDAPETPEEDYARREQIITMADKRLRPHAGQIKALAALERHIVGQGAARAGKVLAPDTPILTSKGWKSYKDLSLGEELFDERGRPCRIVGFSPVWTEGKWYKVTFDTGEEIVAHENHEWVTHTYKYRQALRRRRGTRTAHTRSLQPSTVTTSEIKDSLHARESHRNHAIPVVAPIQFKTRELLIDPYVLGAWLGDGTSSSSGFTSADLEIVDRIREAGWTVVKQNCNPYGYCVRGLKTSLDQYSLINNKHIPIDYLYGSIEQRLSVVQGLMDTDGTVDTRGRCEFAGSNLQLVRDLKFLLRSLGIKVGDEKKKIVLLNGKSFVAYRLHFTTTLPVFRLTRKKVRLPLNIKSTQVYHYIKSVEEVQPQTGRCIEVDSPSHLYLAGQSLIPTHNSYVMALFAMLAMMLPGVEIWVLARIYEDARSEVEYLRKFLRSLFYPYYDNLVREVEDKKSGELTFLTRWGSELKIRSAKSKGSITGRELELALVAEPGWVDGDLYEELRARMSSRLGRIIAFGTPKGTSGMIGRMVKMTGRDPKTGRIVRRNAQERLISNGSPWNISMLVYNLSPTENPGYVQSELDAARQELTDAEYASEFQGLVDQIEGAKFIIPDKSLQAVPRPVFEHSNFVLGIDQGPRNFGACLTAYNGKYIVPCYEYFNGDETTMKANLKKLHELVPMWIRKLGGDPNSWKLTITDRDPQLIGIFDEMAEEGMQWPTDIALRHHNNAKIMENWRRETQEAVNNWSRQARLVFHNSDEYSVDHDVLPGAALLHDQCQNAQDIPPNPEKESKADQNKGWIVNDAWRGDHVVDAWLFTMWTVVSGQLLAPDFQQEKKSEDPWSEHKKGFEYQFARQEQLELTGGKPPKGQEVTFDSFFGRSQGPRPLFMRGHYRDES